MIRVDWTIWLPYFETASYFNQLAVNIITISMYSILGEKERKRTLILRISYFLVKVIDDEYIPLQWWAPNFSMIFIEKNITAFDNEKNEKKTKYKFREFKLKSPAIIVTNIVVNFLDNKNIKK